MLSGSAICKGQKLEIIPHLGIHYSGISYLLRPDSHPEDFIKSAPELNGTWALSIKYKKANLSHVFRVQSVILGSSYAVKNLYSDKKLLPDFQVHRHSDGLDNYLLTYNLQTETRNFYTFIGRGKIKFYYSGGAGIGSNKSKSYYKERAIPQRYGYTFNDLYYNERIAFLRAGIGVFLTAEGGINFYNKKSKNFLTFQAFWYQGLKRMEDFSIDYNYGYFSYPQYQRSIKDVHLKSRGTVFGFTLGVPIRLINKKD